MTRSAARAERAACAEHSARAARCGATAGTNLAVPAWGLERSNSSVSQTPARKRKSNPLPFSSHQSDDLDMNWNPSEILCKKEVNEGSGKPCKVPVADGGSPGGGIVSYTGKKERNVAFREPGYLGSLLRQRLSLWGPRGTSRSVNRQRM
ncbi:hypothetical protein NDU88_005740 [Pleurodeles waltl]|uniref:Uncharacterized protein n=1 Tax=Pleurodeles waltl TaxID=8319 RepID=A0AAV7UJU9_PLEWA|nr:hypothetical protein NDU88_005740 [Pleurodeles waltl]